MNVLFDKLHRALWMSLMQQNWRIGAGCFNACMPEMTQKCDEMLIREVETNAEAILRYGSHTPGLHLTDNQKITLHRSFWAVR